jgi:hypothetical protein
VIAVILPSLFCFSHSSLASFSLFLLCFLFFSFQVICTRAGGGLVETAVLGECSGGAGSSVQRGSDDKEELGAAELEENSDGGGSVVAVMAGNHGLDWWWY